MTDRRIEDRVAHYFSEMFVNRQGRIGRLQFMFAFGILLYAVQLAYGLGLSLVNYYAAGQPVFFILFLVVIAMLFQRPFQALFAKRLHDMNRSGWWFFLGFFMYYISTLMLGNTLETVQLLRSGIIFDPLVISGHVQRLEYQFVFFAASYLYSVSLLMVLFFRKGTEGKNLYGNDPLEYAVEGKTYSVLDPVCS